MNDREIDFSKNFVLVNPPLVFPKNDFLGSGIVYLPVNLAQVNAILLNNKVRVSILDLFSLNPHHLVEEDGYIFQGLAMNSVNYEEVNGSNIIVYVPSVMSFIGVKRVVESFKKNCPNSKIIAIENTQAVIGFSLKYVEDEIYDWGVDLIINGEADLFFYSSFLGKKNPEEFNLDLLPIPEWQGFNLPNYWELGYAHGPLETGRYLSLITSRGCPFDCNFCSIPSMNYKKWRSNSAEYVYNMINSYAAKYGINEFHIEDVNSTVDRKRINDLCELIFNNNLKIIIKFVSGTKIETLDEITLSNLKRAGCNYISFSPESGSTDLLKKMNKPFDFEHALSMARVMNKLNIFSQACFIIGFPGENEIDIQKTFKYIKQLIKSGVDEVAVFVVAPLPGTRIFKKISGYTSLSQLTFSSSWRPDFKYLCRIRKKIYYYFLLYKLLFQPLKVISAVCNIVSRSYKSKMEMTFYRIFSIYKSRIKCI